MNHTKKRFCPKGHDKDIVGKTLARGCNECRKQWYYQNRAKPDSRIKEREHGWRMMGIKNADGSPFRHLDYDRLYQIQSGKCAGCFRHQSELKKALCSDHNHVTNIIRGLLCDSCNKKLDVSMTPEILRNLAVYLEGR